MKENYYGNVNVKLLHKFKAIPPAPTPSPLGYAPVQPDSGRICSRISNAASIFGRLEFQTQLNFMFDMAIPWPRPPPPVTQHTPLQHFLCAKVFIVLLWVCDSPGRRRKIFNAISIGFNSRKSQEICKTEISASLPPPPPRSHSATIRQSKARHASSAEAWQFWLRRDLLLPNICI